MLTPVDVQNKVFKGGIGYDKRDVEAFMEELASDYSELYRSNVELKDKVATLDESLQHYRTIEDSVQKSLTISEKAAEETINAAQDKARQINTEAEKKAEAMLADAKEELENTQQTIFKLQNQHATFINQFKKILNAQLQLCDGEVVDIDLGPGFEMDYGHDSGSYASEGGLGGGGGYTGASNYEPGERPAGEPAANVGSLNLDPFADAKNGGGRFSSANMQKSSNKSSSGKSAGGDTGKISLNIKADQPANNVKVKRNFTASAASATDNNSSEDVSASKSKSTASKKADNTSVEAKRQAAKEEKEKQDIEAQKALEEAQRLEEERKAKEAAIKAEQERKAAEEAARQAKERAEEFARNEQMAKEHFDKEVESAVNAVREAAQKQNEPQENPYVVKQELPPKQKKNKSNAVEDAVVGEVEDKINESTMLDSEDNYSTGFDFVSEDTNDSKVSGLTFEGDDDTYVGEVEDKVNESNMIDSEDNYDEGLDFIVEEEVSEEIPVINQGLNANINFSTSADNDDDDVFVGDVEEKIDESTLIGNDDDKDDGFNFL